MGGALRKEGDLEEALKAYENVLALRPADALANHIVASLTGKTTKAAPQEYVMNLFDNYAETFDESLVQELGYFIPKLISQITIAQETRETMGSILDMGCGTGLLGLELKKYCSRIEGIDLSEKMLEKAKVTKVYDKLSKSEILQYLTEEKLEFDYFIAADVFVYIGDLLDIFSAVKTNNGKAGKLVFSTEHAEFGEFSLQETGRYCHSKEYINKLCAELDFHLTHFSVVDLRKHKGHFLKGGLYILEF
jgi:predicted TPR repeat methyltransferase